MLSDSVHQGILKKFDALKGETLVGRVPVKGVSTEQRVPADQFVEEDHILHDLIRGFYKPKDMPYLISYQATESEDNYGQQIIWKDKSAFEFDFIEMRPPSSPKDKRKKSDILAARYNLENNIPIGVLYKIKKGVNVVLGLGRIIEENSQGIFIVKPYLAETAFLLQDDLPTEVADSESNKAIFTEIVHEIKRRKGQDKFRRLLIAKYKECALCGVSAAYTRASHIKPWAESNDQERLDVHNGLLLCPNHDYLFDQGFISFDSTGRIKISSLLAGQQQEHFNINSRLKIDMSNQSARYMSYHLIHRFQK